MKNARQCEVARGDHRVAGGEDGRDQHVILGLASCPRVNPAESRRLGGSINSHKQYPICPNRLSEPATVPWEGTRARRALTAENSPNKVSKERSELGAPSAIRHNFLRRLLFEHPCCTTKRVCSLGIVSRAMPPVADYPPLSSRSGGLLTRLWRPAHASRSSGGRPAVSAVSPSMPSIAWRPVSPSICAVS